MQRVQLTQSRPVAAFFSFCFYVLFGFVFFLVQHCFTFSCADACHSGIFLMPPPSAPIADTNTRINLSASQYFSVTLALQRALGLQPFAPTSPPPCDFVMLSERVLTDITGAKLFILKADTALRMQLQSNIRTQTWHEAQESIQRGQL